MTTMDTAASDGLAGAGPAVEQDQQPAAAGGLLRDLAAEVDGLPPQVRPFVRPGWRGAEVRVPAPLCGLLGRWLRGEVAELAGRGERPHPALFALVSALLWVERVNGGSAAGTGSVPQAEGLPRSGEMDTSRAAAALGITPRAVRKAAEQGRLPGRRDHAGRWWFAAADVSGFADARRGAAA